MHDDFGTPDAPKSMLEAKFWEYHQANPHVYDLFDRFTMNLISVGHRKNFGVSLIIERIRWEAAITVMRTDGFKISNTHKPYYARLWMRNNPQHAGFFITHELFGAKLAKPEGPPMSMDFEKRVGQYVQLRDKLAELDQAHKDKTAPMRDALEQLGGYLLEMLKQTGQDSAKTGAGTVYRTMRASATIADAAEFRRHVIGAQDWDLVDWRANAPAVEKFIEANTVTPPGINFSKVLKVGVRRG